MPVPQPHGVDPAPGAVFRQGVVAKPEQRVVPGFLDLVGLHEPPRVPCVKDGERQHAAENGGHQHVPEPAGKSGAQPCTQSGLEVSQKADSPVHQGRCHERQKGRDIEVKTGNVQAGEGIQPDQGVKISPMLNHARTSSTRAMPARRRRSVRAKAVPPVARTSNVVPRYEG